MTTCRRCSVDGCSAPHIARGYCQNHYRVFMRHGTPTPQPRERKTHTATGGYRFQTINRKTVYKHVEMCERALGRKLPDGAEVHHINGVTGDNNSANLVICPDHKYHMLLHMRERALKTTGHAHYRKCCVCGQYGDPENMRSSGARVYHAKCMAERSRKLRASKKGA